MEGVACPQCGNPNLDVDAENSVVYCKNCGFAVRVDPQTGNVTPLTDNAGGPSPAQPQAYSGGSKSILGFDPTTFLLGGTAVILLITVLGWLDGYGGIAAAMALEALLAVFWWYKH